MKGKQLRKAVLLGMTMSMALWTTGMAEDLPKIDVNGVEEKTLQNGDRIVDEPDSGDARGIYVQGKNAHLTLNTEEESDISILANTDNNSAFAIDVRSAGTAELHINGSLDVQAIGNGAIESTGIKTYGANNNVSIDAEKDITITSIGKNDKGSYGIDSQYSDVSLEAGGNIDISATGAGKVYGIWVAGQGTKSEGKTTSVKAEGTVHIHTNMANEKASGLLQTAGLYVQGASPNQNTEVNGNKVAIEALGNTNGGTLQTYGIYMATGNTVDITTTEKEVESDPTLIIGSLANNTNISSAAYGIKGFNAQDSDNNNIFNLNNQNGQTYIYGIGQNGASGYGISLTQYSSTNQGSSIGTIYSKNGTKVFGTTSAIVLDTTSTLSVTSTEGDNIYSSTNGTAVQVNGGEGFIANAEGYTNYITSDKGSGLSVTSSTAELTAKNNSISAGGKYGIIASNSSVTLTANGGVNYIGGGTFSGIQAAKGAVVTLKKNGTADENGLANYIESEKGSGLSASDANTQIILDVEEGNNVVSGNGSFAITSTAANGGIELDTKAGDNVVYNDNAAGIGINVGTNSSVSMYTDQGNNAVIGSGYYGVYLTSGDFRMDTNEGSNSISITNASGIGVFSQNGGKVTLNAVNGDNEILSENQKEGIHSFDSTVTLNAENGNNLISAQNYGIWTTAYWGKQYGFDHNTVQLSGVNNNIFATAENGIGIFANRNADMTDYSSIVHMTANGGDNIVSAGIVNEEGYGNGKAINALAASEVTITALGGINSLAGAIDGRNTDTNISLESQNNIIQSTAVITDAGDLNDDRKVISSLYAEDGAQISISGHQNVIRTYAENPADPNTLERAIWAYDKADITIDGQTYISTDRYEETDETQKGNSADIAIAAGTAVNLDETMVNAPVEDRASVNINYDSYTDANGNTVQSYITGDILSAYAGEVNITPKNDTAQIHITGNILAGNNGVLNVNLGNGGTLTGRADDYGDAGVVTNSEHTTFFDPAFSSAIYKGGEVNLTMGEGSRWNVTGQSWITTVDTTGSSNALIDLVSANTERNSSAHALTIYDMKGDATFNMSLDADRSVSDMVYMKHADGSYLINVIDPITQQDMYADRSDGGVFDGLRFATVGKGSSATFRAMTIGAGVNNIEYEVGTDDYAGNDENHHYDSAIGGAGNTEKPGTDLVEGFFENDGTPGVQTASANGVMMMAARANESLGTDTGLNGTQVEDTTNYKLIGVKSTDISNAGKTVVAMSKVNYSNAIYMDRLNKRMGEARYIDGDEGLWVRMRHDRIGKSDAFRSKNTMFELGYDRKVGDREDGEHRQGVVFDYMRGTADYHNVAGEGDVRRGGVWFYDTWLGNKGHYTDYVLKFGRLSNDFDIYSELGEKITGDYSNFVYSASAEYGRKKSLGGDWYIEPQAQLQYAHVTDADYTTSQGTSVQLDAIDSLIGRVGFRLGKDVSDTSTFYIKADVLHEFLGDQDISAFDETGRLDTTYENEGTWYDVGLGFSHQFSKGTYMFLDVEKTFGNDNEDTYQFNVGMNWKV